MIKKNALTALGVILSFVIAVGGWAATSWLMDMESYRLLSGRISFAVNIPLMEATHLSNGTNNQDIRLGLTDSEIVSILQNWELTDNRRPHEPATGQIDMEQAIESGRAGLDFLHNHNILPAEMLEFNNVGAILSQNVPQGGQFLPLRYSYWQVAFRNDDYEVTVTINAATGQIWGLEISSRQSSSPLFLVALSVDLNNIESILADFFLNAEIHPVGEFVQSVGAPFLSYREMSWDEYVLSLSFDSMLVARQSFADGNANATITASGGEILDEILFLTGLIIRLCANPLLTP